VLASAQEAAAKVIAQYEAIRLARSEQAAFVTALIKPRAPRARMARFEASLSGPVAFEHRDAAAPRLR